MANMIVKYRRLMIYFKTRVLLTGILIAGMTFAGICQDKYYSARNRINIESDSTKICMNVAGIQQDIKHQTNLEYYWFKSGKLNHNYGYSSGKLLHGDYHEYEKESGQLIIKGQFKKGLRHGEWIYWYPDGRIKRISNYDNGLFSGQTVQIDRQGVFTVTSDYRKDKLHGKQIFKEVEKIICIKEYKEGKLLRTQTFDSNCQLLCERIFDNTILVDKHRFVYSPEGKMLTHIEKPSRFRIFSKNAWNDIVGFGSKTGELFGKGFNWALSMKKDDKEANDTEAVEQE